MFLLWFRQLPQCGDQISASVSPPAEGRSSPMTTPVFPPSSPILSSFAWFYIFFSSGQVLLSALSCCSACTSVSEGVSWCIRGERCTPHPPIPQPSCFHWHWFYKVLFLSFSLQTEYSFIFFPPYHKVVISNSFRHHWFFRCTEQASMKTPWNFYHEWFGGMVHENSFSSAWQWSKWSIISRITLLFLQSFTKRNIKNINFNADFNQGQKAMSKIRAFFFMNLEWNMTYTE